MLTNIRFIKFIYKAHSNHLIIYLAFSTQLNPGSIILTLYALGFFITLLYI